MTASELNLMRNQALLVPKMLRTCVYLAIALAASLVSNIAVMAWALNKPPLTYAVSDSGRILPIIPLSEPMVADARVLSFVDECVRQSFSHDYVNYRQTMRTASSCYTSEGSENFTIAILPLIKDIEQRRMVMSSTLEPAVIVQSQVSSGTRAWRVQTKMRMFRTGTREQATPLNYVVDLIVVRVPLEENPRGIAVKTINVKPA